MTAAGRFAQKRILVVEDEYFIASDINRLLVAEGAEVNGPVGDLQRAMALAEGDSLDCAVLDVDLAGVSSFPIADRLAERFVPYVFLTGYDEWSMPAEYRDVPRIAKPYGTAALLDIIDELMAAGQ